MIKTSKQKKSSKNNKNVEEKAINEISKHHQTNIWDFLIALLNGFFNLLKVEKIISITAIYLIIRDAVILHRLPATENLRDYLIDTRIIEKIVSSDNGIVIFLAIILAVSLTINIFGIIAINSIYKSEIKRLVEIRRELMHGIQSGEYTTIENHQSSDDAGINS